MVAVTALLASLAVATAIFWVAAFVVQPAEQLGVCAGCGRRAAVRREPGRLARCRRCS